MLPPAANNPVASADDAAALETDTMRFLAIVSICLMAVFALIESIPVTAPDTSLAVEKPTDLERHAEELTERIAILRQRADRLVDDINRLVQQAERERRALDLLERQTEAEKVRLAEYRAKLGKARVQTEAVERRLSEQDEKLERVTARLDSQRQELHGSAQELRAVRTAVTAEEERLEAVGREIDLKTETDKPGQEATQEAPEEPLTLRFGSTGALESLVRQGRVRLFANLGGKTWEATPALGFSVSEPPGQAYLITGSVGDRLETSFKRKANLLTSRTPEWWVVFDDGLTARIASLAQQHRHGSLVIGADGSISHDL